MPPRGPWRIKHSITSPSRCLEMVDIWMWISHLPPASCCPPASLEVLVRLCLSPVLVEKNMHSCTTSQPWSSGSCPSFISCQIRRAQKTEKLLGSDTLCTKVSPSKNILVYQTLSHHSPSYPHLRQHQVHIKLWTLSCKCIFGLGCPYAIHQ